jgi:molecular chaperone Hsp33
MSEHDDSVLRAITDDGAFRVITARTTHTVRDAIRAQQGKGGTARQFGDLLTGTILVRETMAPQLRVQGVVRGGSGGSLIADSHPSGKTRGLIQLPEDHAEIAFSGDSTLQMMRSLPSGRINQGIVQLPWDGGISRALMVYMQTSEQVVSVLAVQTVMDGDDEVQSAGGYIVQLLPEAQRGPLMLMTERLKDFETLDDRLLGDDFSPEQLLDELLYGIPYTRLDENSVRFECWCDELRLVAAIATLPRSDIEELLRDGNVLEISCDYCRRLYAIPPARLRGLLDAS